MGWFSGELSTCSLQSWVQVLDVLTLQKSVSEVYFSPDTILIALASISSPVILYFSY